MDMGSYFRFVAALVFVLGMIGVIALLARRLVPGARTVNRGKKRRLALIEVLPLDAKRRLVLVRRDDTEHLIVLSPNGDVVVERNIGTTFEQLLGDKPTAESAENTADSLAESAPDTEPRTARNDRNVMS
ncbi:flagellar assembly protein FliO [Thalassospira profundimaris]|uniref:Flagellar assembly protein FliO n=1 Tax=Thalassospira profundimaris TaxID=502049 RepID=A0A367X3Q4_9PROT|nr:flagellar biosynthetic protein FliO [Thalassospira profundimaris]RCK48304.1 flagellar assembly protein FliO [Thalassospira profundimaris]